MLNHLPNFLYFAKNDMNLKLTNNLDKNSYNFTVTDKETSRMFFNFDIKLKNGMPDGEYTYELTDEGEIVATGILQIGDYEAKNSVYENNNTYTQYDG